MSLMAWFRRNNKKLMAFVVIALMIVFTIEPIMNYLSPQYSGGKGVIAYYGDNEKIVGQDRANAQQQLEILRMLRADIFLRPQDPRYVTTQDLRTDLLGEVLFAERSTAVDTIGWVRQLVARGNYPITEEQINAIYDRKYPPDMYWLMLVKEAKQAGVAIPVEIARTQLESIIPQFNRNVSYAQFMSAVVAQRNATESQVLQAFADLLSVVEYGKMMCSMQAITSRQVQNETVWNRETMDTEYVSFQSGELAEQAAKPGEEKIVEQFNKYKGFFDSDINDNNPYGFGYKLPDRIQFEYIAVRLDDVAASIPQPTQQETEEFYQQQLQRFTEMVLSDPNDPNSQRVPKTRGYAEVASMISKSLYMQRVNSKAEQILQDAKLITEANMPEMADEKSRPTDEQIKKAAVDYQKTAAQLNEKYKIKVYAGKTGLLSAADVQRDKDLGSLYFGGGGVTDIGLVRILFAVEPLKTSVLGPLDVRPPRLYENIGPLKDARETMQAGFSGKNTMLVRIVAAEKAAEPQSVDQKLDKRTVQFDQKATEDGNSVRELVVEDLKLLAAMAKLKDRVSQFVQSAEKDGWDAAISKFNELYGEPNKPKLTLQTQKGLERIPPSVQVVQEIRYQGDPIARELLARTKAESILMDKFYSLVPAEANSITGPATVVEFEPGMSYYCLKNLVIHRLSQQQFDRLKARDIFSDDFAGSQALAAIHYNPENILKRMNFQMVQEKPEAAGSEEPNASQTPDAPAGKI